MLSVAMGLSAAILWGVGALVVKSLSHEIEPHVLTFWFFFYNLLLITPVAAVAIGMDGFEVSAIDAGIASGLATALAIAFETRAYSRGEVVTVTPMVSLEGAVAAVLGIATGSPVTGIIALGLVLCAGGGLGVGLPGGFAVRSPGIGWALAAAAFFGVSLWVIGSSGAAIISLLLVANLLGTIFLGVLFNRHLRHGNPPARTHGRLALLGALNLAGLLAFAYGSRNGSLPVTAVLAAQFALPAIVGGYVIHKERLTPVQALGTVSLLAGVGILAAGTA